MTTQLSPPRVTVAILAWNAWEYTARCLASLRTTLRPDDHVIVVDNGSSDLTGALLTRYPWVQVLTNEVNQGFAKGCNQAAAIASGEVIIFLNNDTIVSPGWIEELLDPFDDPDVGAVGPRSNDVSGHQKIDDPNYAASSLASIDRFSSSWREAHHGQVSECARLVGFCLAVRTGVFRTLDGFDEGYGLGGCEDDDLCMKLRTAGYRLFVAHGSFVHHEAHATFSANGVDWYEQQLKNQQRFLQRWGSPTVAPLALLSVCLIVKDEEEMLGACLESVSGVADEVIVYDTGSSDRTVEIARSMGARVIEGYWDDSFARARNAALSLACGQWVLSLDADERLLGNFEALRTQIADVRSNVEAYLIAIENLHGAGNARSVHTAIRLFRRTKCTWRHRLHEQVAAKDDPSRRLSVGYLSGARIIHHGYAAEIFDGKDKAGRNLLLAEAALDDADLDRAYALMNYGRALESAGRSDDAVNALRKVASMETDPTTKRLAMKNLVYILGRLRRFDEALSHVEELRRMSVSQVGVDVAEGTVRISMGDAEAGLALLARVPPRGRDDEGMEYAAHMMSAMRAEALASLKRYGEAADVVLDAVRQEGVLEADLGELVVWLAKAQRSASEIAAALSAEDLIPVLGRLLRQSAPVADEILEGVWARFPDRLEPLAAASKIAPRLPIARALHWSARLRGRGLSSACPLVAITSDETLDPRVRVLAAAAAYGSFGDRRVVQSVHDARSLLDADALEATTQEIGRLAPGLLEALPFVVVEVDDETPGVAPAPPAPRVERGRRLIRGTTTTAIASITARGGVNIVGPFEAVSAYGLVARRLATSLARGGGAVSTASYHADGRVGPVPWTHYGDGDHPFETTLLVVAPDDLANFVMDHGVDAFEGRYMIGVWLWDYEEPSEIMANAAKMVHEIWVPSTVTANAVTKVTDRPVVRVPIAPSMPARSTSSRSVEFAFDGRPTFLASVDYETGFERQNALGVLNAFRRAFYPGEGPRLVIGTSNAERYPIEHARLVEACSDCDVSVLNDDHVASGWLFERASDVVSYVSLHRSEGTGLFLTRAMLLGVAAIVSSHSFGGEYFGNRDSFQVPCSIVSVLEGDVRGVPALQWAEPDLEAAAAAMRLVVDQPKVAAVRARRAKDRARRQFSSVRSAKIMTDRLSEIEGARHRIVVDSPSLVVAKSL
jgi:GT2 family glycosyltransferase/tetratricopeptide (TPR) repeat protein